jgi:hypothetical protein
MEWYWWVLIAVGAVVLIKLVSGRGKRAPEPEIEISAMLGRSRQENAQADAELAKVVEVIADLFVVAPDPAFSQTLSRQELQSCVSGFMRQPGLTGLRTHTKMLHVVMSPVQVSAIVKLKPTQPQAAVREFIRIADDRWAFRTRQADDMERAIRAADQESDRVVDAMKQQAAAQAAQRSPASAAPAPSRQQAAPPAQRPAGQPPADPAAQIAADVSSAPLQRKYMNLLWVGPTQLELFKAMVKGGYQKVSIAGAGANPQVAELLGTIARQVGEGDITAEDIDWALAVDAIAGEAESAFHNGDVLDALEKYRDALRYAPGCDVYLMSMGSCYAELGALREAVRYFERAAQISPQNAQIARNLAGARDALGRQ